MARLLQGSYIVTSTDQVQEPLRELTMHSGPLHLIEGGYKFQSSEAPGHCIWSSTCPDIFIQDM
jgi:hypothetical protein